MEISEANRLDGLCRRESCWRKGFTVVAIFVFNGVLPATEGLVKATQKVCLYGCG